MNNVFVYCEIESGKVADVSLELLTKGRVLANTLGCDLEAVAIGHQLDDIEKELALYGADTIHVADAPELAPFRTFLMPLSSAVCSKKKNPRSPSSALRPSVVTWHRGSARPCTAV